MYDAFDEGREEGKAEGEAIGLQKGIEKGKAEAVKKMALTAHRNGYSVAQIQAITNLSEEEVNAIISLVKN
ncbi:MAG: hypothetical protein LBF39_02090 [Prevotellaceae bacterium]|nr:hypothetical protein [Prevotellaceae bacterium]